MFHTKSLSLQKIGLTAIVLLACSAIQAQTKIAAQTAPKQPSTESISIDQQWEYVVVSYGKTLFGSPQKTLAYRSIGLVAGQEAPELENSLDILGRFGWEVITIVGSIGGDQQIVLKRRYNRDLSNINEYNAILKGKELYIKDLIDIMEREQRFRAEAFGSTEAERNKPTLIDLDALEEKGNRDRIDAIIVESYSTTFSQTEFSTFSTIKTISIDGGSYINVEVNSDVGSKFLLNGNTYRLSEVKQYIDKQMDEYRRARPNMKKSDLLIINANAKIQLEGKFITVYKYKAFMSGFDNEWR